MDKLKEFFKNNDVRIGEGKDFTSNPAVYYSSLNEGFYKYFLTFRDKKNVLPFILQEEAWTRKSLSYNFTGSNENIMLSILGFHRFIELFLKDVLRRIDPLLAVKLLEKEEEIFLLLDKQIDADNIRTIEFSETLKRFKYAFKHYENTKVFNDHLQGLIFIIDQNNLETINILSDWRNRIMHNGSTLPNLFAYDYLVSQRLIPLINEILQSEKHLLKDYLPHFFKTASGINIIEEFLKVKFEHTDFSTKHKLKKLAHSLIKLGHLKELGRAAYTHDIYLRKNLCYYEPYYENPIDRAKRFAEAERNQGDFQGIIECICCGTQTLVVYKKILEFSFIGGDDSISWVKCYNCDYSLKSNVGDPNFFGLSDRPIFPTE